MEQPASQTSSQPFRVPALVPALGIAGPGITPVRTERNLGTLPIDLPCMGPRSRRHRPRRRHQPAARRIIVDTASRMRLADNRIPTNRYRPLAPSAGPGNHFAELWHDPGKDWAKHSIAAGLPLLTRSEIREAQKPASAGGSISASARAVPPSRCSICDGPMALERIRRNQTRRRRKVPAARLLEPAHENSRPTTIK